MKDFKEGNIVRLRTFMDFGEVKLPNGAIGRIVYPFDSENAHGILVNFPVQPKMNFILDISEISHATGEEKERFHALEMASKL